MSFKTNLETWMETNKIAFDYIQLRSRVEFPEDWDKTGSLKTDEFDDDSEDVKVDVYGDDKGIGFCIKFKKTISEVEYYKLYHTGYLSISDVTEWTKTVT